MAKWLACAAAAALLCVSPIGAAPAEAAPRSYALAPGPVQLRFRAYGLGMLPIDGGFTRFAGTLKLDSADPEFCAIDLRADAASLRMPSDSMTADALGPDLLDVARFPDFRVTGECQGGKLRATMLLHGVSRPLTLDVSAGTTTWTASGLMRRADWGMDARPLLAGPEVRVSLVAGIPQAGR